MFESLKLSELPRRQCGVLRKASNTRPALWLIEENGLRAAVKDYTPNGFLYRHIIGRFLIWRESKAYRGLEGLKGVPTFYRVIDGVALVIEAVSGRTVEGLEKEERLPERFFQELRDLVESVHKRGFAHCDLKRAPNVLRGNDGKPYIIDWSSAISEQEFRFFPFTLIYRRFILDDFDGILKIQLRHRPEAVPLEEKRRYYHRSRVENLVRGIRDGLRSLLQKIA
jgi:serine/threonine protein kinase